jgi:hypothetical protein
LARYQHIAFGVRPGDAAEAGVFHNGPNFIDALLLSLSVGGAKPIEGRPDAGWARLLDDGACCRQIGIAGIGPLDELPVSNCHARIIPAVGASDDLVGRAEILPHGWTYVELAHSPCCRDPKLVVSAGLGNHILEETDGLARGLCRITLFTAVDQT